MLYAIIEHKKYSHYGIPVQANDNGGTPCLCRNPCPRT